MRVCADFILFVVAIYTAQALPRQGRWYQVESNFYVQETMEVDWKCITVQVEYTDANRFTFQKTSLVHGGTQVVQSLVYSAEFVRDNMLVVSYDTQQSPIPLIIRIDTDTLFVVVGVTEPMFFVWSLRDGGPTLEEQQDTMNVLKDVGFSTENSMMMASYDFGTCPPE